MEKFQTDHPPACLKQFSSCAVGYSKEYPTAQLTYHITFFNALYIHNDRNDHRTSLGLFPDKVIHRIPDGRLDLVPVRSPA